MVTIEKMPKSFRYVTLYKIAFKNEFDPPKMAVMGHSLSLLQKELFSETSKIL